jgi:hypothetical protein
MRVADNTGPDEVGGARLLEPLLEALAAWPDLGNRARVSIEQRSSLTAGEAKAYQAVSISAVRGMAGWRAVADQIRALGRLRYEPAVPTLIGLWEECPVQPIAVAAAHGAQVRRSRRNRPGARRGQSGYHGLRPTPQYAERVTSCAGSVPPRSGRH